MPMDNRRNCSRHLCFLLPTRDWAINVAPPALMTHPDVLECAVVGAPDADRTMIVHAFVVLRPGVTLDPAALQEHCRRVIAPYKAPRVVEFIEALPRTTTGKVQRFRLREIVGG